MGKIHGSMRLENGGVQERAERVGVEIGRAPMERVREEVRR